MNVKHYVKRFYELKLERLRKDLEFLQAEIDFCKAQVELNS